MSQCVPSWDLDDNSRLTLASHSNSTMLDYEVAELTWENGQLAMHGLGPPRVSNKPPLTSPAKYTWDKPSAGGTLESIVNQATCLPYWNPTADELVPWFNQHRATAVASASATMTMDALVPCSAATTEGMGSGTCVVESLTRVGSCSVANSEAREAEAARGYVATAQEWNSRDPSVSGSATCGREKVDTCETELGVGAFTSTSTGSLDSAKQGSKATTADDHDSCRSRRKRETGDEEDEKKARGKSSISTKRSRAAAIHNQSERVYLSLCCTLIASAAGAYLHILWNIGGLLTALVCMGSMVWLLLIPPHQEQKRVALLMAAALFEGASIVPLIDLAIRIDPSILVSAFIGCGVAYGCFSVVAMLTRRREYLYLGGLLSSGLSILFWLHFASSIFGGSTALFTFELYFGLSVFVGYIVVDTNDIIEKAHFGDLDYVKHALTLFTDFAAKRALILFADFAAVFVRILIIMLKNSEEEEEEEKKRRS